MEKLQPRKHLNMITISPLTQSALHPKNNRPSIGFTQSKVTPHMHSAQLSRRKFGNENSEPFANDYARNGFGCNSELPCSFQVSKRGTIQSHRGSNIF